MAFIIKDRIKESTSSTGTGDVSLDGAEVTFDTFSSVLGDGDTTYYAIVHTSLGVDEWEVGIGTYDSATNSITRTTIFSGSSGTSAVNLSSGAKDIFMTYPAEAAVYKDSSGNLSADIGLGNHTLDNLSDVSDTASTDGETVVYNATDHTWVTRKVTTDDISDIDNTGKADGAVLVYENSSGKYKATIIVQGGTF